MCVYALYGEKLCMLSVCVCLCVCVCVCVHGVSICMPAVLPLPITCNWVHNQFYFNSFNEELNYPT